MRPTYPQIWVAAAPSTDPALRGKECVRKPWARDRKFTATPEQVEATPDVIRMINLGDLVEVSAPEKE